jgi:predicted acyl esterase
MAFIQTSSNPFRAKPSSIPGEVMSNHDHNTTIDQESFSYVVEKNVKIPLKTSEVGFLRCNVYLPKKARPYGDVKYPVIVTYGPCELAAKTFRRPVAHSQFSADGKDVPYEIFFQKSWTQINPEMKSSHASWETPDPGFWCSREYIVVRVDERGSGQSPGVLDTMSRGTSEAFFDVIEWCADQEWSTGKVGLLGISYFAGTQWRVAARRPKGLSAIIPWEGMSDYYRDRVRHGGILSDQFISESLMGCLICTPSNVCYCRILVEQRRPAQPIRHARQSGPSLG